MHGVIDAVLALLHLDLAVAADADDGDPARKLGQTLLQLLAVVIRGSLLDLRLDLIDAGEDVVLAAGAVVIRNMPSTAVRGNRSVDAANRRRSLRGGVLPTEVALDRDAGT
jgi:hypothetical protein